MKIFINISVILMKPRSMSVAISADPVFRLACQLAETPVTKRQVTKWRQQRGKAWSKRQEALQQVN